MSKSRRSKCITSQEILYDVNKKFKKKGIKQSDIRKIISTFYLKIKDEVLKGNKVSLSKNLGYLMIDKFLGNRNILDILTTVKQKNNKRYYYPYFYKGQRYLLYLNWKNENAYCKNKFLYKFYPVETLMKEINEIKKSGKTDRFFDKL